MKPKTVFLGEMTNPSRRVSEDQPYGNRSHRRHRAARPARAALDRRVIPNEIARRIASPVGGARRAADQLRPVVSSRRLHRPQRASGLTFMALIEDLCVGFATSGFKRIVFLNGHYDNTYAIAYACANVADKLSKDMKAFPVKLLGRHDRGGCRRVDGAQERPPCKRRGDLRGARDQSAARRHGSRECRVPPFPEYTIANTGAVHTAFFFTSPGSVCWATVRYSGRCSRIDCGKGER